MLDQKRRYVYFYDSNLKPHPDGAPIIPLDHVIAPLCKRFEKGNCVKLVNNPDGHPKSPMYGHLKIPHPAVAFKL